MQGTEAKLIFCMLFLAKKQANSKTFISTRFHKISKKIKKHSRRQKHLRPVFQKVYKLKYI